MSVVNITGVTVWYDETNWSPPLGDADSLFVKELEGDNNAAEIIARLVASAPPCGTWC
ncbi:hypothetical protein JCM33774_46490 [Actinophytocola sp. KF-1]